MLNELEKMIIASIQGDIPVTERPYLEIANRLAISEERLLAILQDLCQRGVIRRFGATIRHQKSGFAANAMVAWQVDAEQIAEVGAQMSTFSEVSHCYSRMTNGDWPYNLYTMIHAIDEASCHEIARRLAQKTSIATYRLLLRRKELKKTSMQYFSFET